MIFSASIRLPRVRIAVGIAAVLVSTLYVACSLNYGWIPHDEGQLGQTAERILSGELPHRDFIEPYTGGLGYLNALGFRIAGVRSEVLRWQMVPFFILFASCAYYIASRVVQPVAAAGITFLCSCLTLPIYPAGMPSWYNLFAATYGTAALLRYLDTHRTRWLVVSGLCGGLSILVKITGLYFVAAGLLWLVYQDQLASNSTERRSVSFSTMASLILTAFGGLGLFFVRRENPLMDVIHFSIPFLGLAAFGIYSEWKRGRGEFRVRVWRLAKCLSPFCVGVAIPIAVFLAPYVMTQSVGDLVHGLFVLPTRRLTGARMALPDPQWLLVALPLGLVFSSGLWRRPLFTRATSLFFCALLLGLLFISGTDRGYLSVFQAIRHQLPLLVITALAMLVILGRQRLSDRWNCVGVAGAECTHDAPVRTNLGHREYTLPQSPSDKRRLELMLLSAATFFISLIQFPYSGGFYFFYAAPMGILLAAYIVAFQAQATAAQQATSQIHYAGLLVFVVSFLILRMHHPGPAITGGPYSPHTRTASLNLDRCKLTVREDQARLYHDVITTVQAHSGDSNYIYAAPDCPEVYFLSGRKNPTRSPYEFLSGTIGTNETDGTNDKLLRELDRLGVRVVVLKRFSEFSQQLDPAFVGMVQQRFEYRQTFSAEGGEGFVVLWRS